MAQPSDGSYEQFVIVAEDQCKIDFPDKIKNLKCDHCGYPSKCYHCNLNPDPNANNVLESKFSVYFAGFEWKCTSNTTKVITLEFKGFAQGRLTEVHLEVVLCDEKFKLLPGFPMRQMLATDSSVWQHQLTTIHEYVYLTIRVLKERPFFPDFTLKDVQICGQKSNGKLRVGDQVFHVNKELLSIFSPYFNALFNGNFDEAKQDEVELQGKTETEDPDPALFHDFLVNISLPSKNFQNALPNVNNVAGLLALAQFYQVDLVRDKCEHHLKFCPELEPGERYILAKKYGLKDLMYHIAQEQKTVEDCHAVMYASIEAEF